ncbi:hypothetical protein CF15_00100 [Pyrodictium occultum]|uniref:CBS domain-containing protein n=1 Tax=Pyrodictium occultum TaxID=2309 RepID=A0A0V8RTA3_PYROC|nr:cation:proton antiporter [Pyrodictium occultum]KSW11312.1 hypothetical protein CF15_00100 [Pyrodictium occultum]
MEAAGAAVLLGLLLLAAKASEEAAERLGLPGFAGSVLAGLILSRAVTGLVSPSDLGQASLLFMLGINFTLFLAGVEELSNPSLLRPRVREVLVSLLLLSLSIASVLPLLHVIASMPLRVELALAIVMAMVSAGPLMKILLSKGTLREQDVAAMRIALIAEVAGLTLFNTVAQGLSVDKLVESAAFIILIYLFGRHYLDKFMLFIERHMAVREAPFAIVVSLVIMAGYIAEVLGFNAAVTALLLGVSLSEYMELRPLYLERVRAFTYGFLEPLFFIGIGVNAARPGLPTLLLSLALLAASSAPKIAVAMLEGFRGRESLLYLAKGGVDAALLLTLLQDGLLGYDAYTAVLMAIVASTILSSLSLRVTERRPDILRLRLRDVDLQMNVIHADETAEYAARVVSEKGAVVVVDEHMRPAGYVVAEDLVGVDPQLLRRLPVRFFTRTEVPIVTADTRLVEILSNAALLHEPIIAVVNEKGEVVGTITVRTLLSLLIGQKEGAASQRRGRGSEAPAPQHPRGGRDAPPSSR